MSATARATPIRVAIGRYEVADGPRLLIAIGRRYPDGRVAVDQLVDRPQDRPGRAYPVEADIRPGDGLKALVADYKDQAEELGHCPMSAAALEAMLERGVGRLREAIS